MMNDKRRELILKVVPQRKTTSKKLKQQALEDIYFRTSSLPQKKHNSINLNLAEKKRITQNINIDDSSLINVENKQKGGSPNNMNTYDNGLLLERKNRSLPKYIYEVNNYDYDQSREKNHNRSITDHSKTKVKKFSQKEQRQLHNLSQEKYRLNTLDKISKRKESKKLIRESFLDNQSKNSPFSNFINRPKHKQSKINNLKYAFQNRKFTDLSKYKTSVDSKKFINFQNTNKDSKKVFNRLTKDMSKKQIRLRQNQELLQEDKLIQDKQPLKQIKQKFIIRDLNLNDYMNIQHDSKGSSDKKIKSLEEIYLKAEQNFQKYLEIFKREQKNNKKSNHNKMVQDCVKLLKMIQKQTGLTSKKTLLFLGKIYYHLNQFNNTIHYIQIVFRQTLYDLSCIDSVKNSLNRLNQSDQIDCYNNYFFILAQSYKHTQNYLCSIKVMNQWQKNVVQKLLLQQVQNSQSNKDGVYQKRKKTISYFNSKFSDNQRKRKFSSNQGNYATYKTQANNDKKDFFENSNGQASNKKNSSSSIREIRQDKNNFFRLDYNSVGKKKSQTSLKKESINYKQQIYTGLRPKSKHLSMKTLSQINLNAQDQSSLNKIKDIDLQKLAFKQHLSQGYLLRARIQYQVKNFYASIQDYSRVLICSELNMQAALQLATLYYKVGRKDKSISFLQQFLQKYGRSQLKESSSINQIKYHLAVLLYKAGYYHESLKEFQRLELQYNFKQFKSQVSFYKSANIIKIQKILSFKGIKQDSTQQTKNIQQMLVLLQKSIDFRTSQFYVYTAYFLKIYLLIFKLKHYYGAQYEIDRMKALIDRNKFKKNTKNLVSQQQKNDIEKISQKNIAFQSLLPIINLDGLVLLTSAIVCILKLKLFKGLQSLQKIQKSVLKNFISYKQSTVVSIQNPRLIQNSQQNNITTFLFNEILKLIYQFKYYGLYTMRGYKKATRYLERIVDIDKCYNHFKNVQINLQIQIGDQQRMRQNDYRYLIDETDQINYLALKALILMEERKFQQALNQLKMLENIANSRRFKNKDVRQRKSQKSKNNLDTISTVIEYRKDQNYFNIIKAFCYICLYKYLQQTKTENSSKQSQRERYSSFNRKRNINNVNSNKNVIKIQDDSPNSKKQAVQSQRRTLTCNQNEQILLAAEDLLSQCLVCDKQNFEILFLISLIHYQLQRYESSLNYIRQAIELSDDHMIKHYYLKANMKMLLGRYDQAIKDYSNALTVFKQFQKEKQEKKVDEKSRNTIARSTIEDNFDSSYKQIDEQSLNPNKSSSLSDVSQDGQQNSNEYYEQQQQMHSQIYLNRAICYLKYSYSLQYQNTQLNKKGKYQEVRQNITNLKSTSAQDIKQYFNDFSTQIKNCNHNIQFYGKNIKSSKQQSRLKHTTTQNLSVKNSEIQLLKNKQIKNQIQQKIKSKSKYLQLLLHTSDVESLLQISKSFGSDFNIKLLSDEQLLHYFYIAKQLNNCLLMMDKIIKKHYLSSKNQIKNKKSQPRKYSSSKYLQSQQQCQPYFKSKKQKTQYKSQNYPQFDRQKYNNKSMQRNIPHKDKSLSELQYEANQERQRVQKMIFDKKILSALKDSSNNNKEDYQNALVNLLEQYQVLQKQTAQQIQSKQCGNIFRQSDLTFFIGMMYFLLQDYQNSIRYLQESYQLKRKNNQLYSLKNLISTQKTQYQTQLSSAQKDYLDQLSKQNLKSFQQIYDNRIYSKQQIQYNIGIAYLLYGDYNVAYEYLQKYPEFVDLIEEQINQNTNGDNRNTKNKLKFKSAIKNNLKQKSLDQISIKTKSQNKQTEGEGQAVFDITPFPTHNRLCSIYPQKQLNAKMFSISFCLPKIELPHLNIFFQEQIQMASRASSIESFEKDSLNIPNFQDTKQLYVERSQQHANSRTSAIARQHNNQVKFQIDKKNMVSFLDTISLKDIEMKPLAPWIKKDKQRKCIRFTDNFLSQSFDLKSNCTTQRKPRNSSKKQMFGQGLANLKDSIKLVNQSKQGRQIKKYGNKNYDMEDHYYENGKIPKLQNKTLKQKNRQKPSNNRYETIDHQESDK